MTKDSSQIRVFYSFPNKLGAQRICYTAWQQVNGLAASGAKITVFTGGLLRSVPEGVTVHTTLARGKLRIPYKLIGSNRAMALHDYIVSRRIKEFASEIDIIHVWPRGARRTIEAAKKFGIPTVLERCNAHTRYAYEVVQKECERLGVALPRGHESAFNEDVLRVEEEEFRSADRLLCPSDFVVKTFVEKGFPPSQLARHTYGFDEKIYYPSPKSRSANNGLTMLFVGVCAVRKGVHYALEAWLRSPASDSGTFLIAGEFLPAYREKLAPMLAHPSVRVLGHRTDVPELMQNSDILVLPSIEEGYGLVIAEAMGSGCVPLVSDACTEICSHMNTGLMHRVGDVDALTQHITLLYKDRALLESLRETSLKAAAANTWTAAGTKLLDVYREVIKEHEKKYTRVPQPSVRSGVSAASIPSKSQVTHSADKSEQMRQPVPVNYVLISPVRDEEHYIKKTLDSVIRQTIRPAQWIIVDDGSSDRTGKIISEYATEYPWITALHRADRGSRVAGSGVMEAFYCGYERLQSQDWRFIGKLDGDVGLEPDYFEKCFQRFFENSKLGICGGLMYSEEKGRLKPDEHPMGHVRGALKLYRRSCWTDIGGLIRDAGWDTVDEVHANMLGWQTRTFVDLKVVHHRPTGEAAGAWHDSVKNGRADYVSGYHPLFIFFKCLRRLSQKPYLLKSLAHGYGYLSAFVKGTPRIQNKELKRYIRGQQMRRLLFMASDRN
ncbi:MAG: glycosyltransferase [Candidatus Sulfotelmatobacter sp.]|jgi:glycosyltransferase involved in cell wall biosynthesis